MRSFHNVCWGFEAKQQTCEEKAWVGLVEDPDLQLNKK